MTKKIDIQAELARLDQLRDALLGQRPNDGIKALEEAQPKIAPGTPAHAALLASGYGMTVEEAKKIIKERDEDPIRWPLGEYRKAQAMLAAYAAKPQVVSTQPPWRVRGQSRATRAVA